MPYLKRRHFVTLLGGAAVSWPRRGWAQQAGMPVVGYLRSAPFVGAEHLVTAFRHGLNDNGFIEGKNVRVEYRSAEGYQNPLGFLSGRTGTKASQCDLLRQHSRFSCEGSDYVHSDCFRRRR
jgi:hypothetical protein